MSVQLSPGLTLEVVHAGSVNGLRGLGVSSSNTQAASSRQLLAADNVPARFTSSGADVLGPAWALTGGNTAQPASVHAGMMQVAAGYVQCSHQDIYRTQGPEQRPKALQQQTTCWPATTASAAGACYRMGTLRTGQLTGH